MVTHGDLDHFSLEKIIPAYNLARDVTLCT